MPKSFGELLRKYRGNSKEPHSHKRLTQQRLGELLGEELGIPGGYSGAAISDWERGESAIHHHDRRLLLSIVKILYGRGGIENIAAANELLAAGNYRGLDSDEQKQLFPPSLIDDSVDSPLFDKYPSWILFLSRRVFFENQGLAAKLALAEEGPPPSWPRKLVALLNGWMGGWDIYRVLRLFLWLLAWLLGYWLLLPSLRWPFADFSLALSAMLNYVAGSFAVPSLAALLTNTRDNSFWKELKEINQLNARLYTYQGAFVGFHVGYFSFFAISLMGYYLYAQTALWWEMAGITWMLVITSMGAQVVPYNLWRAFNRLVLADGAIFFIFILLGPAWGYFFFTEFQIFLDPITGPIITISACALLILGMAGQKRKTGFSLLPVYWWVFVFGFAFMLYQMTVAKSVFSVAALAGVILTLGVLLIFKRIQLTLPGIFGFVAVLGAIQCAFSANPWFGRAITVLALLAWWRWGKKYLSFPPVFWGMLVSLYSFSFAWQQRWLPDLAASVIFSIVVLLLLWWEYQGN